MNKYFSKNIFLILLQIFIGVSMTIIIFSLFVHESIAKYVLPDLLLTKNPENRYINSRGADPIIDGFFGVIFGMLLFYFSLILIRSRLKVALIALSFSIFLQY